MTKKALAYTALLLAWLLYIPCTGQNLVPNPSFESYNNCPNGISGLEFSTGYNNFPTVQAWVNPLQKGSADYFNSCATQASSVDIPGNAFGYQAAHVGNGYVGLIAWEGRIINGNMVNQFGEYIQCKLTQPMVAGTLYCVNFYVSNGVNVNTNFNYVALDKIGINFSSNKVSQATGFTLTLSNSIINTSGRYLDDTSGWMRVTATYKANGGEEWLTLGWFDNAGAPSFQPVYPVQPNTGNSYRTYLYVDDVSVSPAPAVDTVVNVHDSTYCTPGGLQMTLQSKVLNGDYYWSTNANTSSVKITDSGKYWCVGYLDCVTYIDSFKVRYEPAPVLNLGKELINCDNQPITIKPNYTNTDFLWSTGAKSPTITVNQSGIYTLTINDKCGTQTDTVRVYIQPPTPQPASIDTMICQFVSYPAVAVPGTGIRWYTHAGGTIGNINQPPIITHEPGLYSLFVTQTIGKCESPKSPVSVKVTYTPHEELGDKTIMCENDIKVIGTYETGVSYKWNSGATACCVSAAVEGLYKRAATNDCGSFIDSIWIYHQSCEECVTFPNAFTPVKGYKNDIFRPLIKCPISEFSISIFNRWGNLVYKSTDVTEGWNGRYNYDYAPLGTYVYIAEFKAKDKVQKQVLRGNVTLLR